MASDSPKSEMHSDDESLSQLATAVEGAAGGMAETLAAFFLMAGMTKEKTSAVLRAAATAVLERELRLEGDFSDLGNQLGNALAAWWRDSTYLDEAGEPADLPENGPAPSIDALLESHVEPDLRASAKDLLRSTTAISQDGRWRMEGFRGFLRVSDRAAVQKLHFQWSGLLATFIENQARRREPAKLKNFDCLAYQQEYPVAMIPELRAKMAKRLSVVMHDIDALLTSAAKNNRHGPVAEVAVTIFMQTSRPRARGGAMDGKAQWRPD